MIKGQKSTIRKGDKDGLDSVAQLRERVFLLTEKVN